MDWLAFVRELLAGCRMERHHFARKIEKDNSIDGILKQHVMAAISRDKMRATESKLQFGIARASHNSVRLNTHFAFIKIITPKKIEITPTANRKIAHTFSSHTQSLGLILDAVCISQLPIPN